MITRYSAIPMFGIPLKDAGRDTSDLDMLVKLVERNDIEGQPVSHEVVDITPYYWRKHLFQWMLSLSRPEGPAVIEMLPRFDDVDAIGVSMPVPGVPIVALEPGVRRIEIPTDQTAAVIGGPSPRYAGEICLHELIIYKD